LCLIQKWKNLPSSPDPAGHHLFCPAGLLTLHQPSTPPSAQLVLLLPLAQLAGRPWLQPFPPPRPSLLPIPPPRPKSPGPERACSPNPNEQGRAPLRPQRHRRDVHAPERPCPLAPCHARPHPPPRVPLQTRTPRIDALPLNPSSPRHKSLSRVLPSPQRRRPVLHLSQAATNAPSAIAWSPCRTGAPRRASAAAMTPSDRGHAMVATSRSDAPTTPSLSRSFAKPRCRPRRATASTSPLRVVLALKLCHPVEAHDAKLVPRRPRAPAPPSSSRTAATPSPRRTRDLDAVVLHQAPRQRR
jgi:hypothetical protein